MPSSSGRLDRIAQSSSISVNNSCINCCINCRSTRCHVNMADHHRHPMHQRRFTALNSLQWREIASIVAINLKIGNKLTTFAAHAKCTYASANAFAPIMRSCTQHLFIHTTIFSLSHLVRELQQRIGEKLAMEASRR